MARLRRDGVELHYEVTGRGPVLLLTPGFSSSARAFAPLAHDLADCFRVVTWDIRGHGGSGAPASDSDYTVAATVQDMAALLDEVGAPSAVLGGHSLGGYLSLEFWIAHPDRVDGLALIATGPGFRSDESRQRWNRLAERFATGLEEKGLAALRPSPEVNPEDHSDAAGLARAARGILAQSDSRVIDALPSVACPTVVVVGGEDEQFLGGSRYMVDKMRDARLVTVEGAGHAPFVTHHTQVAAAIRPLAGGG